MTTGASAKRAAGRERVAGSGSCEKGERRPKPKRPPSARQVSLAQPSVRSYCAGSSIRKPDGATELLGSAPVKAPSFDCGGRKNGSIRHSAPAAPARYPTYTFCRPAPRSDWPNPPGLPTNPIEKLANAPNGACCVW